MPRADGVPPVFDPVVPDGGGDGGLARLRSDPQSVDARADRPGRGAAVLLRRAVRRLPGRPPAAAPARPGRVPGAGDNAAPARGDPQDRKSVVLGKVVSVRIEPGCRRIINKKKTHK